MIQASEMINLIYDEALIETKTLIKKKKYSQHTKI